MLSPHPHPSYAATPLAHLPAILEYACIRALVIVCELKSSLGSFRPHVAALFFLSESLTNLPETDVIDSIGPSSNKSDARRRMQCPIPPTNSVASLISFFTLLAAKSVAYCSMNEGFTPSARTG